MRLEIRMRQVLARNRQQSPFVWKAETLRVLLLSLCLWREHCIIAVVTGAKYVWSGSLLTSGSSRNSLQAVRCVWHWGLKPPRLAMTSCYTYNSLTREWSCRVKRRSLTHCRQNGKRIFVFCGNALWLVLPTAGGRGGASIGRISHESLNYV